MHREENISYTGTSQKYDSIVSLAMDMPRLKGLNGAVTKNTQEAAGFSLSPLYIILISWRPKVGKHPEKTRFSWLLA